MDGQPKPPTPKNDKIYQAAAKATDTEEWPEYSRRKFKHSKRSKRPLIIAGIVIAILVLAAAAYFLIKDHKASPPKATSSTNAPAQPAPQVTSNTGTSSSLANYVSNGKDLNLGFSYPTDWTVTPTSNNNSTDQTITLNSPSTSIPAADGTTATGKVTVTIRPGTATISELNSNSPVAAQTSAQFSYSQPTADQHQYPYLTFIHFTTGLSTAGAFEEVMITGTQTFAKGAALSTSSLSALDPIIAANFYRCATTACSGTGSGPLSISNATWTNTTLFQQVQTLFSSLKLN